MTTEIWYAITAGIIVVGWLLVTVINRMCKHEWESIGEPHAVSGMEWDPWMSRSVLRTHRYQHVRCKLCGTNYAQELE